MIGRRRAAPGVADRPAVRLELSGVGERKKQLVGEPERQARRRRRLVRQRGQEQILPPGDEIARQSDDGRIRDDDAARRLDSQSPAAVVDALRLAVERDPQIGAVRGDDASVAFDDAPVHAAVVVAGEIARRNANEFRAAVPGADRVDQVVPAVVRFEKRRRGAVRLALGERVDAPPKALDLPGEGRPVEQRDAEGRRWARPRRRRLVDRPALRLGDRGPRIAIGRVQPAATEVERQARRRRPSRRARRAAAALR